MENLLIYFSKSAISLLVFYAIYWLFLRKETYFMANRIYLLVSVIISVFSPLLYINYVQINNAEIITSLLEPVTIVNGALVETYTKAFGLKEILIFIYFAGVCVFTFCFIRKLVGIMLLIMRFKNRNNENVNLIYTDKAHGPFSFFKYIFLNKDILPQEAEKIIAHEKVHIEQFHSLDIMFFEFLFIFQWFNPLVILYKKSIQEIHEYLADEGAIEKGIEKRSYQQLLLALSLNVSVLDLTNNFNTSQIKRRFIMMTKLKSGLKAKLKFFISVFFVAGLMILFACNVTNDEMPSKSGVKTEAETEAMVLNNNINDYNSEEVFVVVDEMPVFGNTPNALNEYIISEMKYPAEAKEKGIQGKVMVSFIINKTGRVTEVEVVQPVHKLLDDEALRVISSMPDWKPGKNKGSAVNVKFNLPIKFLLQ